MKVMLCFSAGGNAVRYHWGMSFIVSFLRFSWRNLAVMWMILCLGACGHAGATELRVASFNVAMGLDAHGDLAAALEGGADQRLRQLAEILQRLQPDIVLLNEFDFDPAVDVHGLLERNYLAHAQGDAQPIGYPYSFRAPVNTGLDSGLDLDGDGDTAGPGDAWGFGRFPGQYGMMVLSRFPIAEQEVKTFQLLKWASLPGAKRPLNPDGSSFYSEEVSQQLRLSSKSHWDIPIEVDGHDLHFLVFHPTPPVFDGPEDRNGNRNYDEIRLWAEYISGGSTDFPVDDAGVAGGLDGDAPFVIAGDFNADPADGDSVPGAAALLLGHPRVNADCVPRSQGALEAARSQGGINREQTGDPAADTADFNDEFTGNLRLDYVLPSREMTVLRCGVFWPAAAESGQELIEASDHRLVWLDIEF
jgi:endonuclease/exonuclease/phosphatase family metal-dependent hydrolase